MSGFEVVGVVLGVLPLVVSGLEQYRDGLDAAKAAIHYREIIADLIVTFAATAARYTTICEVALRRLALQEEEYTELLDNPGGPQWRKSALTVHLQRTLGNTYVPFVEILQRLEKSIIKFARRLQLDVENGLQPEWLNPSGNDSLRTIIMSKSTRLFKCINLGLENDRLNRSLTKIEDDLCRLESLLSLNAATTEDIPQMRRRKAVIWEVVRESAERMFDALSGHWKCFCYENHHASLSLEPREIEDVKGRSIEFQILFLFDKSLSLKPQQPWDRRAIKIHCTEDEAKKARPLSAIPAPSKPSKPPPHPQGRFHSRRLKSVTISTVTAAGSDINISRELTSLRIDSPQASKVFDLCKTLSSRPLRGSCLGVMEDVCWNHQLFDCIPFASQPLRPTSLHEHFANWSKRPAQPTTDSQPLTQPEKYRLLYTLASSVLQLADTAWLPSPWTLDDIYYEGRPNQGCLQLRVIRGFARSKLSTGTAAQCVTNPLVTNATVFSLGVALVEISYGQRLQKLRQQSDLDVAGNETVFTEFLTATRLLPDIKHHEGEKYAEIVERCIKGSFSAIGAKLRENSAFQEQFYIGVVEPLLKMHQVLNGVTQNGKSI